MSEFTVHTYRSAESGILVNAYLLETDEAVVLVDATLLVSDAKALAARAAALGKPLAAAFVTHPHPDHFNGLPLVVPDDVPVYSTAAVARTIAESAEAKREQWLPMFGDEWPDRYRVPDHPLAGGGVIEVAGLRIDVRDVGAGESHADSYLIVEDASGGGGRAAFVGDLVFDGVHSYTADGHLRQWLALLDRMQEGLRGVPLYPGHGDPGDLGLVRRQRQYLLMYAQTVRRLAHGEPTLSNEAKAELTAAMVRFLPGGRLDWLVGHGADAVAGELAADAPAGAI